MKKLTALFLSTLMVLTLVISMATFAASAANTSVTADKTWYNASKTEFTITTPAQLLGFAELINDGTTFDGKTVKLGNDITMNEGFDGEKPADASSLVKWPTVVKEFLGTFDGQNHVIKGIYASHEQGAGTSSLFGKLATSEKTVTIKNLAITNSYMSVANTGSGVLLSRVTDGTVNISNCYVDMNMVYGLDASVDTYAYGVMIGHMNGVNAVANISNCVVAGDIDIPRAMTGGYIGSNERGSSKITNCAMYGVVKGVNNSNTGFIGRICATSGSVIFDGCIAAGGGDKLSSAFWCPVWSMNAENKPDIQIKKSLYILDYPDPSALTAVDESVIIEGETIIGTAAASVLTENGLTDWDAVNGYYPLPKAMSGMVAALQLPTLADDGADDGADNGADDGADNGADNGANNETNNSTGNTTEDNTDDTAGTEATTPVDTEKKTTADEKGGCGSVIGGGLALVAVATVGSCIFVVKKKD